MALTSITPYTSPTVFEEILSLSRGDTLRDQKKVTTSNFFTRLSQMVNDFFHSSKFNRDNREFEAIYPLLQRKILQVNNLKPREILQISNQEEENQEEEVYFSSDYFLGVKKLLELDAHLQISAMGKNLKSNENYLLFKSSLKSLQEESKSTVLLWQDQETIDPQEKVNRWVTRMWIESYSIQRKFAASINSPYLPLKAKDVPEGAILLPNYKKHNTYHDLLGHTLFSRINSNVKHWIQGFLSFSSYTHAEISLGQSKVWHILIREGGTLEDRSIEARAARGIHTEKIYGNYTVLFPNKEKITKEYNDNNQGPDLTFVDIFEKIRSEIHLNGSKMEATFIEPMKLLFPNKRTDDYNCKSGWQPGSTRLACSSAIGALLGFVGIDIGKELHKRCDHLEPRHFTHSSFFQRTPDFN